MLAQMHFPVEFCAVYVLDCSQREARMQEITQEMTVGDALRFLSPAYGCPSYAEESADPSGAPLEHLVL